MRTVRLAEDLWARQSWLRRNDEAFADQCAGRQPRLLIDVSNILAHDAQTGIQRVVRAIWSELQRRDGAGFELQPVFATHRHGYCYAACDALSHPRPHRGLEPARMGRGDIFLGLDLAAQFLPKYRQQLRSWRRAGGSVHVVIYDLLPLLRPEWFSVRANKNFRTWLRLLSRESDQLLCISRQVVRDVHDQLRGSSNDRLPAVTHLPLGGDIAATLPSKGISDELRSLLARLQSRPAVLMVGTVEPRKGYDVALDAFEYLWEESAVDAPDLVIVGKGGWKTAQLQQRLRSHPEAGKRLHWLEAVSDEGLAALYEGCRGLFMASRAEGFGLPLTEAVAHRRPVLARDLPVFREHDLPGVTYFDDDRPEALAARLQELAARPQLAQPLRLPSWQDCAETLLEQLDLSQTNSADRELHTPGDAAISWRRNGSH